jgi:hypothetical protein
MTPMILDGSLGAPRKQRSRRTRADVARFIHAVRNSDEAVVDDTVTRLSRSRRWLAPLTLTVGAFAMLFDGVKLVLTNWRLTLVQVLPAMWIWAAMYDLKLHVSPLHDKAFHVLTGPAIVISLVIGLSPGVTSPVNEAPPRDNRHPGLQELNRSFTSFEG